MAGDDDSVELSETRIGQQQQQQQQQASHTDQEELIPDHELDYQDALIEEREAEIREIETGIHELNEIFRDLGTIVQEQGGHIGPSLSSSSQCLTPSSSFDEASLAEIL